MCAVELIRDFEPRTAGCRPASCGPSATDNGRGSSLFAMRTTRVAARRRLVRSSRADRRANEVRSNERNAPSLKIHSLPGRHPGVMANHSDESTRTRLEGEVDRAQNVPVCNIHRSYLSGRTCTCKRAIRLRYPGANADVKIVCLGGRATLAASQVIYPVVIGVQGTTRSKDVRRSRETKHPTATFVRPSTDGHTFRSGRGANVDLMASLRDVSIDTAGVSAVLVVGG
jgi:hypothetical protein